MSISPYAYNITIRRDSFDGEMLFEARVKELPDLLEYAETYGDAYDLAIDAIETTASAFAEKGKAFPDPKVPADQYSGRVTLRMPRSLHRSLVQLSDEEGVSLNHHIVEILSFHCGFSIGFSVDRISTGSLHNLKPIDRASLWERVPMTQQVSPDRKPKLTVLAHQDIQAAG